jgi:hypothetical protein
MTRRGDLGIVLRGWSVPGAPFPIERTECVMQRSFKSRIGDALRVGGGPALFLAIPLMAGCAASNSPAYVRTYTVCRNVYWQRYVCRTFYVRPVVYVQPAPTYAQGWQLWNVSYPPSWGTVGRYSYPPPQPFNTPNQPPSSTAVAPESQGQWLSVSRETATEVLQHIVTDKASDIVKEKIDEMRDTRAREVDAERQAAASGTTEEAAAAARVAEEGEAAEATVARISAGEAVGGSEALEGLCAASVGEVILTAAAIYALYEAYSHYTSSHASGTN